jgi:hypothetical protein
MPDQLALEGDARKDGEHEVAVGESKRRRETVLNGPCPCGATKLARLCCFNRRDCYKPPAVFGLKALPRASRVEKCSSCVAPISGEHLISESVIRVLMADGDFSVSGLPWLEDCEEKLLPPRTFTANCLCVKHNSALHPLDAAAKYFFTSPKSCLELDAISKHAIVSGHDIERWLLKTAKALAVSKNFAKGRERLSGAFARDEAMLDMLDNPGNWPDGAGLYCIMNTGELTENHPRFQLQPSTNDQGKCPRAHQTAKSSSDKGHYHRASPWHVASAQGDLSASRIRRASERRAS